MTVDGILVVTSRPLYDHGSRAGVTRCFIHELGDVVGERNPVHDCYLDVTVGSMCLFDRLTHEKSKAS
jgi:hypothetical protein